MKKKNLGRGLDALLSSSLKIHSEPANHDNYLSVPIDSVITNPNQPRKYFDENSLQMLAKSIKEQGILQPIVVYKISLDKYAIIAGERRLRAATIAQLKKIPITIQSKPSEQDLLLIALVENLQREDLNFIDQSNAFKNISDNFGLTHDDIAKLIGVSRSYISNIIRLSHLVDGVKDLLLNDKISVGHAKSIVSLPDNIQLKIAEEVVTKELNVRSTEEYVNRLLKSTNHQDDSINKNNNKNNLFRDPKIDQSLENLSKQIGLDLKIKANRSGNGGKLLINFNSEEELDNLLRYLNK